MIVTITLNPALDLMLTLDAVRKGESNRVERARTQAAGKGVNAAKILRQLEQPVRVTGFLGGSAAGEFSSLCDLYDMENRFVSCGMPTRINVHLYEKDGDRTELLVPGPEIAKDEWENLLSELPKILDGASVCAVCGSVPPGITAEMFTELLEAVQKCGVKCIVDGSGENLQAALATHPALIKPNREELCALLGKESATDEVLFAGAKALLEDGPERILLSLGGDGAALFTKEGAWRVRVPKLPVENTLGCGDTMVASCADSLDRGDGAEEMLLRASALSAANALTAETAYVDLTQASELMPLLEITPID